MSDVKPTQSRIHALDGLRGVAVLGVVGYHLFANGAQDADGLVRLPYQASFAAFPPLKYGFFGVSVFFSISGFVIARTLTTSRNWLDFVVRRFARLWPAMLLCSMITYGFSFVGQDFIKQSVANFLPSLTFTDPRIANHLFHTRQFRYMDFAYWSLFTEVRFYALVAVIYFWDKKSFYSRVLGVSCAAGVLYPVAIVCGFDRLRQGLSFALIAPNLPWLTFGVGCYYSSVGQIRRSMGLILSSVAFFCAYGVALAIRPNPSIERSDARTLIIEGVLVFSLLPISLAVPLANRALSNRVLRLIGLTSYGLYLIHQNVGKQLVAEIGNPLGLSQIGSGLYGFLVVILLVGFAFLEYYFFEVPVGSYIRSRFGPLIERRSAKP